MKIDKPLILKLENLARLQLSVQERTQLTGDLNTILEMVEKLNEVDTNMVEPLIYINETTNVWRADEVKHQVSQVEALQNAPDKTKQYFKVPKVINLD